MAGQDITYSLAHVTHVTYVTYVTHFTHITYVTHFTPDCERPDETVDGAVSAPVGRAAGHRAEHGAAESL